MSRRRRASFSDDEDDSKYMIRYSLLQSGNSVDPTRLPVACHLAFRTRVDSASTRGSSVFLLSITTLFLC